MEPGIAELESVAALGWRGTEEAQLGDWLLRASGGFTGRANSALASGSPGMPLAEAAAAVRAWYAARQLPATVCLPYPLGGPDGDAVDSYLAEAGWAVRSGAATVMTAEPAVVASQADRRGPRVLLDSEPDDAWLARYEYRGQHLPEVARRVLVSAPWQAFGSIAEDGQVVAVGRVAVASGWGGLTAITVHPQYRRRGLATTVTAALAAVAVARGARGLYLQVADANTAARTLYRRLGFRDHHGYHYRVAPS